MTVRVVALLSLAAVLATPQGAHGRGLSFVPLDHWAYEALDRLATLGLVPLDALASRPITRLEAGKLMEQALVKANVAGPAVARLAREDLQRLAEEFSVDSPATVTAGGLAVTGERARFAPDRSIGASAVAWEFSLRPALSIAGRVVGGGEAVTTPRSEIYASFARGSVTGQVGRAPLWWGPSLRSSLLLSDNAGTLPLVRLTAGIPRVRLTKVVALLERPAGPQRADALLVGTRLDWLVTPRFRLGLSESVVTTWGHPLIAFHLVHPLPIFFSAVAANYLHDVLGAPHNALASVDFDWLIRPGVRMYGGLLVDDAGERLPLRQWRLGLLAGLHLLDPFRTGRTNLRLEYSLVTNGTYSYCCGLEHAYFGRSLGHWLGPDGDDLYLELTHRVNSLTTLRVSYAYTRRGQGYIGQPAPGPEDWFLTGIVERRHTLGLRVHRIHSSSLETRYRAEIASLANRGNVAGAHAVGGLLSVDVTYRWPAVAASSTGRTAAGAGWALAPVGIGPSGAPAGASVPAPLGTPAAPPDAAGRISLRHWAATGASQGPLSAAPGGTLLGASYRTGVRGLPLIMGYDADARGDQVFWSADLHYPLGRFPHGTVSVFAGWGGLRLRGTLGGTPQDVTFSGPRLGMDLFYRPALNGVAVPLYLTGNISTNIRGSVSSIYLWTYALGAGWSMGSVTLEAGYRGAAAMWRVNTPDQTALRWDGLYLVLAFR